LVSTAGAAVIVAGRGSGVLSLTEVLDELDWLLEADMLAQENGLAAAGAGCGSS